MEITARPPTVFVKGQGSWVTDSASKGTWISSRAGPSIAWALINASPAFYNQPMLDLAAALTAAAGLERLFFANSGAEANEGAIKLARKWGRIHRGGAHEIITTHNSFHGRTLATMAASGKAGWDDMSAPGVPGFVKVPFGDLNAVAAAINVNTTAVMVEPIQGEAGVIDAPDAYMLGLRALTEERAFC